MSICSGLQDRLSSDFFMSLFWLEQSDMQKDVIQPAKKHQKRSKHKTDRILLSLSSLSVSRLSCREAEAMILHYETVMLS